MRLARYIPEMLMAAIASIPIYIGANAFKEAGECNAEIAKIEQDAHMGAGAKAETIGYYESLAGFSKTKGTMCCLFGTGIIVCAGLSTLRQRKGEQLEEKVE